MTSTVFTTCHAVSLIHIHNRSIYYFIVNCLHLLNKRSVYGKHVYDNFPCIRWTARARNTYNCRCLIRIKNEKITETVNTVYIRCQDAINVTSCLFNYHTYLRHKHNVMFTALVIKILSHKSCKSSACMSRTNQSSSLHSCLYRQQ